MSTPGLHIVSTDPHPHNNAEDQLQAAEAAARAEISRARQTLPRVEPAVWDCYLGQLTAQIAPTSEADPISIYASLLCVAGVRLGQKPHVQAGDDRHPLLVWPLIIGRTGNARKGASWSAARRILAAADPEFAAGNIRSGLTSGEGLAAIFAEQEQDQHHENLEPPSRGRRVSGGGLLPSGDRRLVVFEPEWAAVMARMRRDGNTLSATLRAAWEGGDLSTLNVSARVAPSSHVGLLAHISPEEFRAKVSSSDLAGGTYNRFLPIAVARAQFLAGSTGAPAELVKDLGYDFGERLGVGSKLGMFGFTPDAARLWRQLYVEFGSDHGDTGPIEQFLARTAPNCLRIAAIHAALDQSEAINTQHLNAAAGLVRYSIASVRTVFNHNESRAKLLAYITDAGQHGRTRTEIADDCFGKNKNTKNDIEPLLSQLLDSGVITQARRPSPSGRGRPAEVYVAAQPQHAEFFRNPRN